MDINYGMLIKRIMIIGQLTNYPRFTLLEKIQTNFNLFFSGIWSYQLLHVDIPIKIWEH